MGTQNDPKSGPKIDSFKIQNQGVKYALYFEYITIPVLLADCSSDLDVNIGLDVLVPNSPKFSNTKFLSP